MEIIDQTTSQNIVSSPVNYAGFLLRFVAFIIDRLIIGFATFIIIIPALAIFGISIYNMRSIDEWKNFDNMDDSSKFALFMGMVAAYSVIILISVALNWLYYALMESSERQATIGKLALGIKVTDMNGNRITFLNATGRYFGKIISNLIFFIGYIIIIFTPKKQGLHDIMAGTLVVRKS